MRRAYLSRILLGLAVASALVAPAGPPPASAQEGAGVWAERSPMVVPPLEKSIAELGDRIYALGGYPGARITSADVQVYDARTDTWSLGPPLPLPLHHTMAAAVDGRLYVIGGEAGNPAPGESVFQAGVYMLDEAAGEWVPRAAMPTARSGGGAGVIDGKIYVAGGRPPRGHDFAVYDPRADEWTFREPIPTARSGHGAVWYRDRIFVMGGEGTNRAFGQNEAYDPAADRWESYAPMLTPRHGMGAVVVADAIYVAGGGPQMGGGVKSAINEAFSLA